MKKYESLKKQYPEYVSLDQLHRICKIAKRSALYLVKNRIIPAIDTNKKTWRYKIAIDDVIVYLNRREQSGSMIPSGAVSSRNGAKRPVSTRKSFSQLVLPGQESDVAEYFNYIYSDYDEVLTTADVVEMTGLNKSTIMKLAKAGFIKSLAVSSRYLIPKQYLMEFLVTPRFIEAKTNSEDFKKILGGFEVWKAAK